MLKCHRRKVPTSRLAVKPYNYYYLSNIIIIYPIANYYLSNRKISEILDLCWARDIHIFKTSKKVKVIISLTNYVLFNTYYLFLTTRVTKVTIFYFIIILIFVSAGRHPHLNIGLPQRFPE